MTERAIDREMIDCYLTVLEAYDPEAANRIEAAYEARVDTDEEIAGMLIEHLAEHGVEVDELWK